MTQHTPGPWVAEDDMSNEHKGKGWIVRGADGKPLMGWGSITTTEANARVMAAAPELLAACLAADTGADVDPCYYDHHGNCQAHGLQPKGECYMELIRAAIAKAKGEV